VDIGGHYKIKEVKHILESEDEKRRMKLKALAEILNKKLNLLNTLDDEVLATCPTDDIEREIEEADDIKCRIWKYIQK